MGRALEMGTYGCGRRNGGSQGRRRNDWYGHHQFQPQLCFGQHPGYIMVIIAFRHYLAQQDCPSSYRGPTYWRFAQSSLSLQLGMCIQTIKHMASSRLICIFSSIALTAMFAMRVMIVTGDQTSLSRATMITTCHGQLSSDLLISRRPVLIINPLIVFLQSASLIR